MRSIAIPGSFCVGAFLSWSYEKGETKMSRNQTGYTLTIYRRQADRRWKIWKQLWTDVRVADK